MERNYSLTKKQITQLALLVEKFPDVDFFTLTESNESGIGPTVKVLFTVFDNTKDADTEIDITDYSTW